jgi:predicted AAA+ superfamily ATPase
MHPLTIDELPEKLTPEEGYHRLLTIGGFPEPFLGADEREARRWRRERFDKILREDIRDLDQIRDIQILSLFVDALRKRVGGMVILSNLAGELQISPKTAKHWLILLEKMYLVFPVYPLSINIPRAIVKPPKVFFYDNGDVIEASGGSGAVLENLVATTLLKRLDFIEDYHGHRCSLHYIRDKDGREVDFVTMIDGVVHDLIEVKNSDTQISSSLKYYAKKLQPKRAVQLVGDLKHPFDKDGVLVTNPIDFFKDPPWGEIQVN